MVTKIAKIGAENGLVWMHLSGSTSDMIQRFADEGFTGKHVVKIDYSNDGTTMFATACRRA